MRAGAGRAAGVKPVKLMKLMKRPIECAIEHKYKDPHRVSPWISPLWLGCVCALGAWLALGLERAVKHGDWGWAVLAFVAVAALQNQLQNLQHEAGHGHLHPWRPLNDALADLLIGLPILSGLRHYRRFHLEHHRFLGDPARDPEPGFYAEQGYHYQPLAAPGLAWMLLKDVSGFHFLRFQFSYNAYLLAETRAGRLAGLGPREWATLGVGLVALGCGITTHPLALLAGWFLPLGTLGFLILKLQGYGEHAGAQAWAAAERAPETTLELWSRPERISRLTWAHRWKGIGGTLASAVLCPLGGAYHLEHHWDPGVPWYGLPELSRRYNHLDHHQARRARLVSTGYFLGAPSIWRSQLSRGKALEPIS